MQMLSVVWDFDPVMIRIGSFDIRYYGLMWAVAILVAAKFFDNFVKPKQQEASRTPCALGLQR